MKGRRSLALVADLGWPLLAALGLSVVITAGGLDLAWQRSFFSSESSGWPRGDAGFWRFLYDFASVPVLVVCAAAIVALVAGFRWNEIRRWRRVAWYGFLMLLVGPGLIANLWLKETWGRPRPREVDEFGGTAPFEGVFSMDLAGEGKSFPCGHATMGFYFIGLWFLLRRHRPVWAWTALLLSLAWGGLIGMARMLQGGHFASDVVWAGAVMWVSAAGLFYALRLDQNIFDAPTDAASAGRRVPILAKAAGGLGLTALILGVALATPYRAIRDIQPREPAAATGEVFGSVRITRGETDIRPGPIFRIKGEAWGHGLPTSQIAERWEEETDGEGAWRFKYLQRDSGRFTEIHQTLFVEMPWERAEFVKFDLGPGASRLRLPRAVEPVKIELVIRSHQLTIQLEPGATCWFDPAMPVDVDDRSGGRLLGGDERPPEADYALVVSHQDGGGIMVIED